MKRNIWVLVLCMSISLSCKNTFLEQNPIGAVNETTLATKSGVNGLLIGAYSLLDGIGATGANYTNSLTLFSDWASDDAHVGTEPSAILASYEFYTHDATTAYINPRWTLLYAAVQRSNDVLRLLPKVPSLKPEEALQLEAEAKFLRAYYHFEAVKMWRNVPFVDETITYGADNYNLTNDGPIWSKIEADLQFAAENLTETKGDVGRVNKWAAMTFLARAYMYQYKFADAKTLLSEIIANGKTSNGLKYALNEYYIDNFKTEKKHGPEAVFVVQMSVYDGANGQNGNAGDSYNGTYGGPATCCYGWTQPSFDLVNAYQTDASTGLPLLDTYSKSLVKNDQGLSSATAFTPHEGPLDARLDWNVGRRGIPYLDWGLHPGMAWIRQQSTGGPYSVIKNIAWQARVATDREGGYATNNPVSLMRFADVLLMAAEAEVEVGDLVKAQEYVNTVRARAAKPGGYVKKYIDNNDPLKGFTNVPAANYKVGLYSNEFVAKGKDFARNAVRMERRLELALEHNRFFDLQRWDNGTGFMSDLLNKYMDYETNVPLYNNKAYKPQDAKFVKGKNEIYPIPQLQIDMSMKNGSPLLKQNPQY